ncbi:MAG: metallophosphoesterase family protein [Clostridia bacterium]|nr:metallophosphoesterase family protein [Clostridia bacterium]
MKILLISDSHSNVDALCAVERQEKTWDAVWFLGDMLDYGFFPHETVEWMRKHNVQAVMGNHDHGLLEEIDSGKPVVPAEQATRFAEHNRALLTAEDIAWLRTLPDDLVLEADGITYYLTHYYFESEEQRAREEFVEFRTSEVFERVWREKVGEPVRGQKRRILYGHTHQCTLLCVRESTMFVNPGSLSYRVGPDVEYCKGSDYMVIEDGEIYLRHVNYETDHLLKLAEQSSLTGFERHCAHVFYSPEVW